MPRSLAIGTGCGALLGWFALATAGGTQSPAEGAFLLGFPLVVGIVIGLVASRAQAVRIEIQIGSGPFQGGQTVPCTIKVLTTEDVPSLPIGVELCDYDTPIGPMAAVPPLEMRARQVREIKVDYPLPNAMTGLLRMRAFVRGRGAMLPQEGFARLPVAYNGQAETRQPLTDDDRRRVQARMNRLRVGTLVAWPVVAAGVLICLYIVGYAIHDMRIHSDASMVALELMFAGLIGGFLGLGVYPSIPGSAEVYRTLGLDLAAGTKMTVTGPIRRSSGYGRRAIGPPTMQVLNHYVVMDDHSGPADGTVCDVEFLPESKQLLALRQR